MWVADGGAHAGAARRQRERRLHAYLRYARMSVAMALAEASHHTAPRGQRTARAGGEERDELNDATEQKTPQPRAASTVYLSLDDDGGCACRSADRLYEVRPQAQVLRHMVQQIIDPVPSFPALDDPVPQMVEQLPDILRFFRALSPDPEQVIEVPKILPEDVSLRTAVREPQLVEQLMEMPTIVSYSLLLRTMEQHVEIPVPGGGGRLAGLQGSLPGQSSTAPTVEQIVDIPGGSLQGSRPGQGSPASSSFHSPAGSDDDADEPRIGCFSHFSPFEKSAKVTPHSSPRVLRSVSSSELSAHQMPRAGAGHSRPSDERTSFVDAHGHRCAWTRWMARTGGTWTCSTRNGTRHGSGSCGGAPDSVHRRRGV